MSSGSPPAEPTPADVFFYAPIGLLLDAHTLTPELARRGRHNVRAARLIGELTVRQSWGRLDDLVQSVFEGLADAVEDAEAAAFTEESAADPATEPAPPDLTVVTPDLPIPDYDTLAASQVVKRLSGLTADELEEVRVYEESGRARRTILAKIIRLQAS